MSAVTVALVPLAVLKAVRQGASQMPARLKVPMARHIRTSAGALTARDQIKGFRLKTSLAGALEFDRSVVLRARARTRLNDAHR